MNVVNHVFGVAGSKTGFGLFLSILLMGFASAELSAQPTQFTYQGSLNDEGSPGDGNYDFEFALFDQVAAGGQVGTTLARPNVAVADGIFTVELDFGSQFPGADRFLEIRVRAAGGGGFTTLAPRQQITSAPYAVNARNLGGVGANQYVLTGDARLSDARSPLPGSPHYIQNSTGPQASSSFNVSGTGQANVFDATESFHIGGERVLAVGASSTYAGVGAGTPEMSGSANAFFGTNAGNVTTASNNSFFGFNAGRKNVGFPPDSDGNPGGYNSFIGSWAGAENVTGAESTFVGALAGRNTVDGFKNTFVGFESGHDNTGGDYNVFIGGTAGLFNTTGGLNTFVGSFSGSQNQTGTGNTIVGGVAGIGAGDLTNAAAIGYRSFVTQSNSLVLGSINGVHNADASTRVGIGTTAPTNVLTVVGTGVSIGGVGSFNEIVARFRQTSGANHLGVSIDALAGTDPILYLAENGSAIWDIRNNAGNDTFQVRHQIGGANTTRFSISATGAASVNGTLAVSTLGSAGATALCRNASNQIATCSSSIRYKSNIANFSSGLDLIKRLRPVSFEWKDGGLPDLGFVAEEVAGIEPLLTTLNADGRSEGVKYDRLGVVLVNAVKEQQQLIESKQIEIDQQNDLIRRQQAEIDLLQVRQTAFEAEIRALVCSQSEHAGVCHGKDGT